MKFRFEPVPDFIDQFYKMTSKDRALRERAIKNILERNYRLTLHARARMFERHIMEEFYAGKLLAKPLAAGEVALNA